MALPKIVVTKKAQSALEFLTTYGWAFLVILIMIGALSYFGVLDPSRFLPDKCIFGAGIGGCQEFGVINGGSSIILKISNNLGENVVITNISGQVTGTATACTPVFYLTNTPSGATPVITQGYVNTNPWNASSTIGMNISCGAGTTNIATGERPTARVVITYIPVGKSYNKSIEGEVSVKKIS